MLGRLPASKGDVRKLQAACGSWRRGWISGAGPGALQGPVADPVPFALPGRVYAFSPCSSWVSWSPNPAQVLLFRSKALPLALTFTFVWIAGICHPCLEYVICENCCCKQKKKFDLKMIVLARGLFLTL